MNASVLESIRKAHLQVNSQLDLLYLLMFQISDIRNDRVNLFNVEHRTVRIEGFHVHGARVLDIIRSIRFNDTADHYVRAICTNAFRGTAFPVHEVLNNREVADAICSSCFPSREAFESYKLINDIVRHVLSHNYLPELTLRCRDLGGNTVSVARRDYPDGISFVYDAHLYFKEAYPHPFEVDFQFATENLCEGRSLFDCISVNNLMFLCELNNNCLWKLLQP